MQWKTRTFKSGQADAIDLARSTMICYAYCQAGFEYLWKPATEEVYAKSLQNLIFATLASVATSANCHWWRQLTLKKELSANKKSGSYLGRWFCHADAASLLRQSLYQPWHRLQQYCFAMNLIQANFAWKWRAEKVSLSGAVSYADAATAKRA